MRTATVLESDLTAKARIRDAAMALFGIAPIVMKPTALVLNILVALIGSIRFYRAGFFSWRTFWPFAAASTRYKDRSDCDPIDGIHSVGGVC